MTVSNTGMEIPEDGLDKLFDSFYTTKPSGLGMGLAISRSIARGHGGELSVVSNF